MSKDDVTKFRIEGLGKLFDKAGAFIDIVAEFKDSPEGISVESVCQDKDAMSVNIEIDKSKLKEFSGNLILGLYAQRKSKKGKLTEIVILPALKYTVK